MRTRFCAFRYSTSPRLVVDFSRLHSTPDCGRCGPLAWGYWELSPVGALRWLSKKSGVSCFSGFLPWCKPEERRLFLPVADLPKLASEQVGNGKKHRASPCITARFFPVFVEKDAISWLWVLCGFAREKFPDFITSLVGWSAIIDYQLVISLFQQLMVTQLRIMEWYPSLTAPQTVNVFVLAHIALPSPDDKGSENHVQAYAPWGAHPFRGQSLYMTIFQKLILDSGWHIDEVRRTSLQCHWQVGKYFYFTISQFQIKSLNLQRNTQLPIK